MTKANLKRLEEGKLYYSISEVCAITGLEQHVLRYWESEFPQLRPKKNRSGNRAYRAKEIKIIRYIKYLLYEEMYTIPGAKKKMADANMADLEGQLTLIRVPAAPVREPAQAAAPASAPQPHPVAMADTLDGSAADGRNGHMAESRPEEATAAVAAMDENPQVPAGEAPGGEAPGGEAPGGEAYARLREELRRVKQELQDLLAALAAAGKGVP